MMGYDEVDATIAAWAKANVKKLYKERAGEPVKRFAYLTGLRPFECFQIVIRPPLAGRVIVSAHSVDTCRIRKTWCLRLQRLMQSWSRSQKESRETTVTQEDDSGMDLALVVS